MSDSRQIEELKKQILILNKQLESKTVQNKNLSEKCDIQGKRIKFLKKEIDQLKLNCQRLEQSQAKMAAQLKTAKESNKKLKESMDELTRRLKQTEESGPLLVKTVTIGERVIDNTMDELDLAGESVTDQQVKLLINSKRLRTLILGDNLITDIGALQICDNLTNLTKLFLNNNQITDNGTVNLHKLKQLKYLDLRANKLTGECAVNVSKLTTLTQLSLSNNSLNDAAVGQLSKLTNLRYLDLTSNKLTDSCVVHILKLSSLTHLYFSSNQITAQGVRNILGNLQQLAVADARFNSLKNQEKAAIRDSKKAQLQLFI